MRRSHITPTPLLAFLGMSLLCGTATGGPLVNDRVDRQVLAPALTVAVGEDGTHFSAGSTVGRTIDYAPASRGLLNIAIVASAAPDIAAPFFTDARDRLLASGHFAIVATINAALTTPSVKELDAYDAVLVWSNVDFADPTVLGDNLAYYVNGGGGVVIAVFANSSATENRFLGGRWLTLGYEIIPSGSGTTTGQASMGTINVPGHPLVEGVNVFSGGANSFRPLAAALSGGGSIETVAEWDDGRTLVAVREDTVGSRVDLGFYPVSDGVVPGYWDQTTDGDLLLANALRYAAERPPLSPGDSDADGDVDANDAGVFSTCFTGEDAGPVTAGCVTFDFDFDDDVDCFDWSAFTSAWTEPGDPPKFAECSFAAPVAFDVGGRYLAITPPAVANPVALLVTGDPANPSVACLSAYVQTDATLGPTAVYQTSDAWGGGSLFVTDTEIVPDAIYRVQADHGSPGAPLLSAASTTTTWLWGDANNDGGVDLNDILCILDGFEGSFVNCGRYAVDLIPEDPDFLIDLSDILAVLDAFQGVPYGGPLPCK